MVGRRTRIDDRRHIPIAVAVFGLHASVKKKARDVADWAGTFSPAILASIDHETRVGIILNQQRIEKRRTLVVLEAISAAISPVLDKSLFEAAAVTPEQATADYARYEARQQVEQVLGGRHAI